MKITYSKFPGLIFLRSEKDFTILMGAINCGYQYLDSRFSIDDIIELKPEDLKNTRKNANFITESFILAQESSHEALSGLISEGAVFSRGKIKEQIGDCSGVLIRSASRNDRHYILYYKIIEGKVLTALFVDGITLKDSKIPGKDYLLLGIALLSSGSPVWYNINEEAIEMVQKREIVEKDVSNSIGFLLYILLFKKYAEVETKEAVDMVDPGKSPKNICKALRLQNTPFDFQITRLSTDWYTEIIKTGEIKVRGHWRLQPYRNGEKKLIFINPFIRHGYHRRAKMTINK